MITSYKNKTLKNGFSMPPFGKGTWMTNIGKKNQSIANDEKRIQEIKSGVAAGVQYIDTAERYANGYGETLIGKAIKGEKREKLFLVSKVSSENLAYDDVILAVKGSLKRLQTSYLDLYLIHQFNADIPLTDTMKAMDYLIEKKLIKNIGVCNFTVEQLKEAQSYSKNKIVVNQVHYNLMHRELEQSGIIEYCQKHDVMIIAWRPYQSDSLTSKTRQLLEEMGSKYDKTFFQIAIMWLMTQPNIVVLSQLNTVSKIEEMVDAGVVKMDEKDMNLFKRANN